MHKKYTMNIAILLINNPIVSDKNTQDKLFNVSLSSLSTYRSWVDIVYSWEDLENYTHALVVSPGVFVVDIVEDIIKIINEHDPDYIMFDDENDYCYTKKLNSSGKRIKYFSKHVQENSYIYATDTGRWADQYNFLINPSNNQYYLNSEVIYRGDNSLMFDKDTICLLCSGTKGIVTLKEFYKNNHNLSNVIFYDINEKSVERFKQMFTSKDIDEFIQRACDGADDDTATKLDYELSELLDDKFWIWVKDLNITFENRNIILDYSWIPNNSSIWLSNIFAYLPTRLLYGVEYIDNVKQKFIQHCKDNGIVIWYFLPIGQ